MANNSSSGGVYDSDYYDYYNLGSGDDDNGYKEAEKYIWIVGGVTLLVVGTFGNLLALAVLTRPKMRRSNAAVYLIVVAVTDLAALYTGLLRQVILRTTGRDIREESDLSCKLHTTLVYVFLDFSAWLLAALSLERLFSVCRPHTVKHRCTRVTSACVISGIGIASLAINAHFLFRMGDLTVTFGDQARTIKCVTLSEDYYYFVATVWPWVDLTVFALLPLVIHIVCNVFIVKSVVSSFRQARRSRGTGFAADSRYRTAVVTAKSSSSGQILNSLDTTKSARSGQTHTSVDTTKSARSGQTHTSVDTTKSACSGQTHTSVDTTKRSAANGPILNSVDTTKCARSGQTHTSVDTTKRSASSGQILNSVNTAKSAPCGLTHTSADSFVGGSSSIGVNCTVCNRECTCEDRSLARLKECCCKSECSSQEGKLASLTSSLSDAECSSKDRNVANLNGGLCDAECSSKDRNVASLNGGLCGAECSSKGRNVASLNGGFCDAESSSKDRNVASLNGGLCHAECSSKDKIFNQTSSGRTLNHTALTRGCTSLDGDAEDNATDVRTQGPVAQDSETCPLGHVQNNGLNAPKDTTPFSERTKQHEGQDEIGSNSEGSEAKFVKNDSRGKTTSAGKDPGRVSTLEPSSAPFSNSNGSDSQTMELTVSQTDPPTANSVHTKCKPKEKSGCVKASVDRQRSSTAASPYPTCARDDSRVSSMTVMLVTVSSVFCVTTVPISLYTIINWILVEKGYDYPYREVIWAVVNILMYTNNAVNFILYSLSGSRFRAELKDMWHTLRQHIPRPSHVRRSRASTSHSMTSNCGNTSESYVEGRRWSSLTEMSSTGSQDAGNPSSTATVRVAEEDV